MTERLLPINSVNGTVTTVVTNTTTITYYINGTDVLVNWTSIIDNGTTVDTSQHTEFYNPLYERTNISITAITTTTLNRTHSLFDTTIITVNGSDTSVETQIYSDYKRSSRGPCLFPFTVQAVIIPLVMA